MAAPKSDTHASLSSFSAAAVLPSFFGHAISPLDFHACLALSFITAVLTPCFRRGSAQRYGMLALQLYFTVQAYLATVPPTGNLAVAYSSGVLLGNLTLRFLDRLYLHVPEEAFRRVHSSGVEEKPETLSPSQKLWWSAELLTTTRGVGWNWRVPGTPKAASRARAAFVFDRGVRWVAMYGSVWLAERICAGILDEWAQLPDGWTKRGLLALTHNTAFLYVFVVLLLALTVYTHFAMLTLPAALLCVGIGIGPARWRQPEAWPATFGSLAEAYSLRRFWSHCWHQQVRRTLGVPAAFVLSILPAPLRTSSRLPARLFRRYFGLLLAFLLSGAFHTVGHSAVLRARRGSGDDDAQLRVWGEMPFFLAQGVGIMLEDLLCHMLGVDDRRDVGRARRLVGYIVTAAWYGWTRVQLKAVPMAATFGISDGRGPLLETMELVRVSLAAIPGNFVKMGMEQLV
ncbi:membrane bound O-acyl transferase family-domain-containing protein [Macrophomina phaseolina]|uniref:Membrane bound O-acyl transferase family-domain-containing protein n=1 Tax=Macrophomina phaseolina TaxID=35725 RepID=A0ABQ8FQZ5_9PEZI|nr:membrane bound O-acyl transferase family-domain-containing protein [Macrophomina phaseolina]